MWSTPASRQAFRNLHKSFFLMPNPWDVGSAKALVSLGFPALATSSAGLAFSLGLPDNAASLEQTLVHVRDLVKAVSVPVNADFGYGFARDQDEMTRNVRECLATGCAGLSIEDLDSEGRLLPFEEAVARVGAAVDVIKSQPVPAIFTARTECYLAGHADLHEVVLRIKAFAAVGADVVFAPGLPGEAEIRAVVASVRPTPVNVLNSSKDIRAADLEAWGVCRVSVGSGLSRAAWGSFLNAARSIKEKGDFGKLASGEPYGKMNNLFRK
jgi:2-methylisocitrate lyase-like PEP mutase family enzyme